jgi:hypothetical protein
MTTYFIETDKYVDGKFASIDERFDKTDEKLARISEDVNYMRLNFGARFDVEAGHSKLLDQGQLRLDERLTNLERRVENLEDKAS